MALANVLGFKSNNEFDRSLQCQKTDNNIDEFCPTLNIENIAQFITLPPYADVKTFTFCFSATMQIIFLSFSASKVLENGQ